MTWVAFASGVGVFAVSGVFLALGLRSVEPLNGAYGGQAMLAFELAETPAELARVIGSNPPSEEAMAVRKAMDRANYIDFLYMLLYAVFIASSCAGLALSGRPWLWLGAVLGPVAALFDVAENLALLALTKPDADVPALLQSLHVRTFGKWELLAATSVLFASGFVGSGRWPVRLASSAVAILALAAGALTAVNPAAFLSSLASTIAGVWLWQLAFAAQALFRPGAAAKPGV